jgi:prepilin-type N-terminal cleavage/methylation domain-containing protein
VPLGEILVIFDNRRIVGMELQKIAKILNVPLNKSRRLVADLSGKNLSKVDGFTLIETMVALAIFAVGIMAVGAMLVYSTRTRVTNKQIEYSVTMAHAKMEELRKVATREVDVRYSTVLNFNYILSRDPNYGTISGFVLPGFLSGAAGITAITNDLNTKLGASEITADEYEEHMDEARVMYDDGNVNHGDETAGDGIWSSLEYINMDTLEVKTYERFNALSNNEKKNWGWIIKRRTTLEPISLDEVAGSDSKRSISHVTLATDVTDTTAADVAKLVVECTFTDMTRHERTINFETMIARSSM